MNPSIKLTFFSLLACIMQVSCNNGESLQPNYIEHQDTTALMTDDTTRHIVEIDQNPLTEDQKEAYNSVKRLNFLGVKHTANNHDGYDQELSKVTSILNDTKYMELMEFN